jgi:hypothetical protein
MASLQIMDDEIEINIFLCLNYIRDNAPAYAQAKANRIYLEEFRKSKKSILMQAAESAGQKSAVSQERDAYASADYLTLLEALRDAVEAEELLRWRLVAAQAKISVWQSLGANQRAEAKNL